jgi:hypothetical protein
MAVMVNDLGKNERVEANAKPAQSPKTTYNKKTEHGNVFQTLLNELKLNQSRQEGSLRNKPASSELVHPDHRRVSKNPGANRGLNSQDVNTLAASTLIALAAISSGPNRLAGLCATGGARPGSPVSIGRGSALAPDASMNLSLGKEIGALSAHFESGEKGPGVIGYDYQGGTSYGTYQISSKAGTMKLFIDYLAERAPDLAGKLQAAGPPNTGSRSGKMPEVWQEIAAADPARFEKLQYDFIDESHYRPALEEIAGQTGLDISKAPRALQEVLWSTAVQHGPKGAVKIFTKAVKKAQDNSNGIKMAQLIGSVYDTRAGQFRSAGLGTRAAVRNRFLQEGRIALAMLSDPFLNSQGVRV